MVNLTYGALLTSSDGSISFEPLGTDILATLQGNTSAFDPGDIAWVLTSAALIVFMLPGLGYLYSGLARRKNALSMLFLSLVSLGIVSFQWFFIGYSLVFSESGGSFFGDGRNVGFRQVLERPVPETNGKLPEIVFATYQLMFACLVPAVLLGAAAERSRILPAMIFIFCWTTLVYDMLAHWIWSSNGWAYKWARCDITDAGGVPVEIASGTGGLAYSYFIGKRRGYGTERVAFKPSNVGHVVLGTVFLWVGWLGFNGGSCFAASLKAAMAVFVTNLAGSVGGIVWLIMDFRLERKWSMVGFCTGAIAGLVAITPAAGFVGAPAGALIGLVSAAVSNLSTRLKVTMRVDDPMDIFAVHALAGVVGVLMTGLFAQSSVAANDGFSEIDGGWMDHNWVQFAKQIVWALVGLGWTFVVTYAIMFVINLIPGCHFRSTEEAEIVGMDEVELGEFVADYAFHHRDLEGLFDSNELSRFNSVTRFHLTSMGPKSYTRPSQAHLPPTMPRGGAAVADAYGQGAQEVEKPRSRSRGRERSRSRSQFRASTPSGMDRLEEVHSSDELELKKLSGNGGGGVGQEQGSVGSSDLSQK
ncbi:amt family ammonium transporter [Kwoniella mangroviensis CBS 10435]|uniref:Ammonium transporter n=1 Tax=Kwoniella mangroviensis CBS 10435 TaxID=1331196 RepID=A0A1B9IYF1_9TREE|nr:amt family ammonium transporter [Kwoniella mangroviensis CBS 8507]OCF60553.1 amt family ammonium transporter [Kwoniella mangroviensis CBS 10435]OCF70731.1 amt family ammonium transporter [Kwoniella mangroviensis CBS 8507]